MSGRRDLRRVIRVHDRIAGVYADTRFDWASGGHELRALLVSMIWLKFGELLSGEQLRDRLISLFPTHTQTDPLWEIRSIIRKDCPRFEPPDPNSAWHAVLCEAPMIRREGPCGQRASEAFRLTDPVTGHWRMAGGCSRHREWGRELHRLELERYRAGVLPEPIPNRGGLAPTHFRASWPDLYAWADPNWTPPKVGIVAADWPVLAQVQAHARPDFTAIPGGAQTTGDRADLSVLPGGLK